MTNAEKINNMTSAELFYFMFISDRCDCYVYNKNVDFCFNHCEQGISLWLSDECKGELI